MQNSEELQKEYQKMLEEKLVYLKGLNNMDTDSWRFEAEKDDIKVSSIYDEKTGFKIIRAQTIFNAPVEKIVEVAEEITTVLEWDKTLDDVKPLHRCKECYIMHIVIKKIPFIVQREVIVLARFFYDPDGNTYGVGTSLSQHPDVEDSIYKVRAEATLIGWVLKPDPNNPEKTELTYILNVNPKGWIPKPGFNWFVHNQGFNVKPFAEHAENRYKRDKQKVKSPEKPTVEVTTEKQKEEEIISPTGKL